MGSLARTEWRGVLVLGAATVGLYFLIVRILESSPALLLGPAEAIGMPATFIGLRLLTATSAAAFATILVRRFIVALGPRNAALGAGSGLVLMAGVGLYGLLTGPIEARVFSPTIGAGVAVAECVVATITASAIARTK